MPTIYSEYETTLYDPFVKRKKKSKYYTQFSKIYTRMLTVSLRYDEIRQQAPTVPLRESEKEPLLADR